MEKAETVWHKARAGLLLEGRAFIDGEYRVARDGRVFPCVNPATDQVVAQIADCDAADVDDAVAAARRAFEDGRWRALPLRDRKRILRTLADLMHRNALPSGKGSGSW